MAGIQCSISSNATRSFNKLLYATYSLTIFTYQSISLHLAVMGHLFIAYSRHLSWLSHAIDTENNGTFAA